MLNEDCFFFCFSLLFAGSPGFGDFTGFQSASTTATAMPATSQQPSLMPTTFQQQQQQPLQQQPQQPAFADFGAFSSQVCVLV